MRTVTIRDFQRNLFKELKDLPVTVTRSGTPLIVVTSADVATWEMKPGYKKFPERVEYVDLVKHRAKKLGEARSYTADNVTRVALADGLKAGVEALERNNNQTPITFLGKCTVPGCKLDAFERGWHWEDGEWYQVPMCNKHKEESEIAHRRAE